MDGSWDIVACHVDHCIASPTWFSVKEPLKAEFMRR